jgi:hypothetical protein
MSIPDLISQHITALKAKAGPGGSVTVGGVTKTAIVGAPRHIKQDDDFGGRYEGQTITVVLLKADWGSVPTVGDKLTHNSKVYKVETFTDQPGGVSRTLICTSLER